MKIYLLNWHTRNRGLETCPHQQDVDNVLICIRTIHLIANKVRGLVGLNGGMSRYSGIIHHTAKSHSAVWACIKMANISEESRNTTSTFPHHSPNENYTIKHCSKTVQTEVLVVHNFLKFGYLQLKNLSFCYIHQMTLFTLQD